MRITVLVENASSRPDLKAEHGLALWIETGEGAVLFDTGASDAVVGNARALGIDLADADAIVISHGHYDHTGGLGAVAEMVAKAPIYIGPTSTDPKLARRETGLAEIGWDPDVAARLRSRLRTAADGDAVVPDMTVLTGFGRSSPLPSDNDRLLAGTPQDAHPDPFEDEIAVVVTTRSGPVLVSGCSHRGIGNIVTHAVQRFGPLAAVLGGFHLHKESEERVREIARAVSSVPRIFGGHCTGATAMEVLKDELGPAVSEFHAGTVVEIE